MTIPIRILLYHDIYVYTFIYIYIYFFSYIDRIWDHAGYMYTLHFDARNLQDSGDHLSGYKVCDGLCLSQLPGAQQKLIEGCISLYIYSKDILYFCYII